MMIIAPRALLLLASAVAFLESCYALLYTDNDIAGSEGDPFSFVEEESEDDRLKQARREERARVLAEISANLTRISTAGTGNEPPPEEKGHGPGEAESLTEVDVLHPDPPVALKNPKPAYGGSPHIGREPADFRHSKDHSESADFVSSTEWEAEHARAALIRLTTSVHTSPKGSLNGFWYQPWSTAGMTSSTSVGSGWIVSTDPIVIVTNSHVVRDGVNINLQFPILGKDRFDGIVRMISPAYDLAFVMFAEEEKFLKTIRAAGLFMTTLRLANVSCPFGAEVLAVGFSLGGSNAKVSKGIISGSKTIKSLKLGAADNVCQTTAPISPGNSGGPLIYVQGNLTVAGVIFASENNGQNNNYVVPGFRVRQLLDKLLLEDLEKSIFPVVYQGGSKKARSHIQMRLPPSKLVSCMAYPAVEKLIGACPMDRLFVTRVPEWSVFHFAEPPLPPSFVLLHIDEKEVDLYGQSRAPGYFSDPISYTQKIWLRQDIAGNASMTVCANGVKTEHKVPLQWRDEFDPKVPEILEPSFHEFDYEHFAGVTIQELTLNHVEDLMTNHGLNSLARFTLPSHQKQKHLFLSAIQGSAALALEVGMIVETINGITVNSLDDYRRAFLTMKSQDTMLLQTDQGVTFVADVSAELVKLQKATSSSLLDLDGPSPTSPPQSPSSPPAMTPAVRALAAKHGIL